MNAQEESIVATFIAKAMRSRYRTWLNDPARRDQALQRLNHCDDFDLACVTLLRTNGGVAELLLANGGPPTVYVMSASSAIDGLTLPIAEAVERMRDEGWGTILLSIPSRLAYYYDEEGSRRALLKCPSSAKRAEKAGNRRT